MKERDVTDLLVMIRTGDTTAEYRPFVVFQIHNDPMAAIRQEAEPGPGYLVWLAPASSVEQARTLAAHMTKFPLSKYQMIDRWHDLPSGERQINGVMVRVFLAMPDQPESQRSELLIGRISHDLLLWGVHNPR